MSSANNGGERSGPAPAMTRHCSFTDEELAAFPYYTDKRDWSEFERERSLLDYQDGLEEQREETERIADDQS